MSLTEDLLSDLLGRSTARPDPRADTPASAGGDDAAEVIAERSPSYTELELTVPGLQPQACFPEALTLHTSTCNEARHASAAVCQRRRPATLATAFLERKVWLVESLCRTTAKSYQLTSRPDATTRVACFFAGSFSNGGQQHTAGERHRAGRSPVEGVHGPPVGGAGRSCRRAPCAADRRSRHARDASPGCGFDAASLARTRRWCAQKFPA